MVVRELVCRATETRRIERGRETFLPEWDNFVGAVLDTSGYGFNCPDSFYDASKVIGGA